MSKIVWTNGTFDLLHPGHIKLFEVAKSLGDKLIVGVDSDEKIKEDKGRYPINDICFRQSMLQAIRYIDVVVSFNSRKELERLICMYNPDVLLIGGDWREGDVVGEEFARCVRFFDRVGGYSSSRIREKCKDA
jgi:D-beta-D-heptose 7-phosphate kinase/D-beta-D-heptose 1-phosphate adenosyltransferase